MKQVILIGMFLLVCCVTSNAQTTEIKNQTSIDLTEVINHLKYNKYIYIQTFDKRQINGRFIKLQADTLYLLKRKKEILCPLSEIESIKLLKSNMKAFVLGGIMSGAATGYLAMRNEYLYGASTSLGGAGAAVGGVAGLVLGVVAGTLTEKYEDIYSYSENTINNESDKNAFKFNLAPDLKGGVFLSASLSF